MMPVEELPAASWQSAFTLGFVSAVFDNIPLTALALRQGGFDWGFLAYAVGFGGSMLWFGSSAGVALASMYPEGRSAAQWLTARLACRRSLTSSASPSCWQCSAGTRRRRTKSDGADPSRNAGTTRHARPVRIACGQPEISATMQRAASAAFLFVCRIVGFATSVLLVKFCQINELISGTHLAEVLPDHWRTA